MIETEWNRMIELCEAGKSARFLEILSLLSYLISGFLRSCRDFVRFHMNRCYFLRRWTEANDTIPVCSSSGDSAEATVMPEIIRCYSLASSCMTQHIVHSNTVKWLLSICIKVSLTLLTVMYLLRLIIWNVLSLWLYRALQSISAHF